MEVLEKIEKLRKEGLVDQQPGYGGFADAINPEQSLCAESGA